ncbi:hypothetical protein C163_02545 [Pseudomonas sp. FGI182]|nr:hypothetical protein C163_02545 [Pseudomonas sp. FGI182]
MPRSEVAYLEFSPEQSKAITFASQDNRRLLIRQFGYSPFAVPLVLAEDPLLVRG